MIGGKITRRSELKAVSPNSHRERWPGNGDGKKTEVFQIYSDNN